MAANALANTKMDLIAALVQRELRESASLMPFVSDFSNLAGKGVKQLQIPKYSSFTVQDRAFGAAASENAALTDSTDVINIDKNKIVLFGYDAADEIQSTTNYLMEATRRAATAHGRQVNSDILGTWDSVAGYFENVTASAADITVNAILNMREFLMENHADMSRVFLIIGADQEKAMLKLAEFSRYDYRGNGSSPILTGQIGSVYGVPVVINQQVGAQQAYMVEVGGSGVAFQRQPAVAEQPELTYGTDGRRVAVDQLYGLGGLQLGEGEAAATKSPLITQLNEPA